MSQPTAPGSLIEPGHDIDDAHSAVQGHVAATATTTGTVAVGVPTPGGAQVVEPVWRQRAIDRSTQAARARAAKRVQRFLTSAREIIAERDSTEFTVQEVVDHAKQSLRSFYQYFDGKHALLLAMFEEEMTLAVARLKAETGIGDPLERLRDAVGLLDELSTPGRTSVQPLFFEFAQRLLVDHPEEVAAAYRPLVDYFGEIVESVAAAGLLRPGRPRRLAAIALQAATITAGRSTAERHPIIGDEVWEFCLHALVPDDVVAARRAAGQDLPSAPPAP